MQYKVARIVGLDNKDLIVGLPCGFGKSWIYVLATLMRHVQSEEPRTMCLVVSPLLSIIRDQLKMLQTVGLRGVHLQQDNLQDINGGESLFEDGDQVLFAFISEDL